MKKTFRTLLLIDLKNTRWTIYLICSIAVIILAVVLQLNISDYKAQIKDVKFFTKIEDLKARQFPTYSIYGTYGIRLIFCPPQLAILFPVSTLFNSHIDTGIGFTVFSDLTRNGLLTDMKGFIGLSTFFILYISLSLGLNAFSNRDLFKFYKSILKGKAFFPIFISKFVQVLIVTTFILAIATIQCIINGFLLSNAEILDYFILLTLTSIIFIAVGMILDIYFKKLRIPLAIVIYIITLMFIPMLLEENLKCHCDSLYTELRKLKSLISFENRFSEKVGKFKDGDPTNKQIIDLIESGQRHEYKDMRSEERNLIFKLERQIRKKHLIASFFPGAFIINYNKEINGGGYKGLLKFIKFTQYKREKFIRFYITKKFYEQAKKGEVVPFPESHVFIPDKCYPDYMDIGIMSSIFFIIISIILAYNGFVNKIDVPKKTKKVLSSLKMPIKSNSPNIFFTKNQELMDFIFHSLYENSEIVTIDGIHRETLDFVYLPELKCLPKGVGKILNINKNEPINDLNIFKNLIDSGKIVVTSWNLDDFGDTVLNQIFKIAEKGIYLNIGASYFAFLIGGNQLYWEKDETIKYLNPHKMAARLFPKARN